MIEWIWNGCLPNFPWWCDGFVWTAICFSVLIIIITIVWIRGP